MDSVTTENRNGNDIGRHPATDKALPSSQNGDASVRRDDVKIQPHTKKSMVKILDTTQLVRVQLIHENWTFIESKRSRLFSTSSRYSVLSLVPPSSFSDSTAESNSLGSTLPVGGDGHVTIGNGEKERHVTPTREVGVEAVRGAVDDNRRDKKAMSEKPWNFENGDLATQRTSPRRPRAVDDVLEEYRNRALSRHHNGNGATRGKKRGGNERGKNHDDGYEEDDEQEEPSGGNDTADDELFHRRANGSSRNRLDRINRLDNADAKNGDVYDNGRSRNNSSEDNDRDGNGLHGYDVDDEDFDAEVLTSVTRRKQLHKQLPDRLDTTKEDLRLFGDPGAINGGGVGHVDVDALCVTPRVDADADDNVTLLPRWAESRARDVIKPTVVPSYENLVSLQRDTSRPLLMYIPEPVVDGKPSVGDV